MSGDQLKTIKKDVDYEHNLLFTRSIASFFPLTIYSSQNLKSKQNHFERSTTGTFNKTIFKSEGFIITIVKNISGNLNILFLFFIKTTKILVHNH